VPNTVIAGLIGRGHNRPLDAVVKPRQTPVISKNRISRYGSGPRRLHALTHVAYSYVMPTKSDPGEIGDVEPLADSTASQARRVVAAYANDADECRIFLSMLGIGPAKLDT